MSPLCLCFERGSEGVKTAQILPYFGERLPKFSYLLTTMPTAMVVLAVAEQHESE